MTIELIRKELIRKGANSHYKNRYINLIQSEDYTGQLERHHILPKSIFPEYKNDEWNIVELTPRKHFIAHTILYHMFNREGPMQTALWFLLNTRDDIRYTSRMYDKVRQDHAIRASKVMSETMKGKTTYRDSRGILYHLSINDEKIENLGLKHISTNMRSVIEPNTGRKFYLNVDSPKIKELGLVSENKGMIRTEEQKEKMRGRVTVKDESGSNMSIMNSDPRYISGGYIHINKNTTNVIINGEPRKVTLCEYNTGEYTHINKGMVDVKLKDGTITKISKSDIRLTSGLAKIYTTEANRKAARENITNYNKSCIGKVWMTAPCGKENLQNKGDVSRLISEGYQKGRKTMKKPMRRPDLAGRNTYNNGIEERMVKDKSELTGNWVRGRIPRAWITNGIDTKKILLIYLDEWICKGWVRGRTLISLDM